MKASINDSFTVLREMVLGDVDVRWAEVASPEHRTHIEHILGQTKEELNDLAVLLAQRGIKVHRPVLQSPSPIVTPYYSSSHSRLPLSPSDLFLILGSDIIEMASYDRQRQYERMTYRSIMLDYHEQGNGFISMPQPLLTAHSFDQEILMEASNVLQVGKDVFVTTSVTGNIRGLQWLSHHYPKYDFHDMPGINGHIDCHVAVLRPGLVLCNNPKMLHEKFRSWEIMTVDACHQHQTLLDDNLQDDDFTNTNHGITFLALDPNTLLFNSALKDSYKDLIIMLEKKGFDMQFTTVTYGGFFNQGLTCMCLETVRQGGLEDYF